MKHKLYLIISCWSLQAVCLHLCYAVCLSRVFLGVLALQKLFQFQDLSFSSFAFSYVWRLVCFPTCILFTHADTGFRLRVLSAAVFLLDALLLVSAYFFWTVYFVSLSVPWEYNPCWVPTIYGDALLPVLRMSHILLNIYLSLYLYKKITS